MLQPVVYDVEMPNLTWEMLKDEIVGWCKSNCGFLP